MLKWIDIPPVWLAACAVLAWVQAQALPLGLSFGTGWTSIVSIALIGAGVLLIAFALLAFMRHKTTPIPHQEASNLITTGIFAYSRNPIYLADALILAGLVLRWDAVLSVVLIPGLIWIIDFRFIRAEEFRLERAFGDEFLSYKAQVRRWL